MAPAIVRSPTPTRAATATVVTTPTRAALVTPIRIQIPTPTVGAIDDSVVQQAPRPEQAPPIPTANDLAGIATLTPPATVPGVAARPGGVPILMYHYIRVNPVASDRAGFILSVTPSDFAQQMRLLAENGFHTVTMAQVREYIVHGTPLPPKPIALTFDDGYDDAYTVARPVLERYHQTATFFIVTGFVDRPRYMTWSQVEALDRDGMEIGSHTVHHLSLPSLGRPLLHFELDSSRATLERHLGHPVLDFCYPGGEVNATVVRAVQQAGYLSATTTRSGVAARGQNPLELPRLRIWGGMTLRSFASVVGQPMAPAR